MSTDAIDRPSGTPGEPAGAGPPETHAQPVMPVAAGGSGRRNFLKAAALGAAAVAFLANEGADGLGIGPVPAYAHNLSSLGCSANDVRIEGPGIVLNEACNCSGTFTANVQFRIINNTGTDRYCVTMHLCDGLDANGNVVFRPPNGGDIVVGDIPANFDGLKTIAIPNYPCGAGKVCFGRAGSQADGSFLKGEACPTGACCSTITWNVKGSDPCPDTTRQISSKCRRQQICIVGRGHAVLDCSPSTPAVDAACAVPCGGTTTVRLSTTGLASQGPFTYELSDGQTFTNVAAAFKDFTVGPVTGSELTLTGWVTDAGGCKTSASAKLTTTAVTPTLSVVDRAVCNGVLTIRAAVAGRTCSAFAYSLDGAAITTNTETDAKTVRVNADGTLTYRNLDGACHTVGVRATCGDCTGTATLTVTQACVATTMGCTP